MASDLAKSSLACGEKSFSLDEIYGLYKDGKIIFNTEYQRSYIWPPKKKQLLIDSILRKFDISKVFLRQRLDGFFECLDGQQRLRTIFDFLENQFPVSREFTPEVGEKLFKQLDEPLQWKVRGYVVSATLVYNTDDETTSQIFLRLQEGMPLISAEKLNAMRGKMRNKVLDLRSHPIFKNIGIRDHRFAHRYLCAQCLALELNEGITDIKFNNLSKFYKMYKDLDVPDSVVNKINKVFNLLHSALGNDAKIIAYKADFISIYLLVSNLLENYAIAGKENRIKDFIMKFLLDVGNMNEDAYYKYAVARSTSSDSRRSLQERFDIMLAKFLEFVPDIETKDRNRLFNYWQKLAIYYKDKGVCQICNAATPFDKGEADHKKPHSKGGPTTVDNGRWLCEKCNKSLSNKESA